MLSYCGDNLSRSPHGERGLKCNDAQQWIAARPGSLSSWRAWIEMERLCGFGSPPLSLSSWRAWIEIHIRSRPKGFHQSLSSWRAWIEIESESSSLRGLASLSSWRAWIEIDLIGHAPGVGHRRSPHGERGLKSSIRSIKQNASSRSPHGERGLKCVHTRGDRIVEGSLSSWRAWIEILGGDTKKAADMSLSSWRAWIEIAWIIRLLRPRGVALLMESVD